ncbi:MAG TPA: macro domain-containing protein [Chloroflexota bacterium]|nr:macro domain-containing protein [Chloroflexota bacterium]
MEIKEAIVVGQVSIDVVEGNLLAQPVTAIMLSANNKLEGGSGFANTILSLAGPTYEQECEEVARAAGPEGLRTGSATVVGGYGLAQGNLRRRVIQAITIHYRHGNRTPAPPEVVYRAVRSGLEKAELYRVSSVATYLMAMRPGYRTQLPDIMAEALCRAVIDHATIAGSVSRIVIVEESSRVPGLDTLQLAVKALKAAYQARY